MTAAPSTTYAARRDALEDYFDRTAADTWAQLTSDAPVSKIRATVRAGRDRMRATLLDWLPEDLCGQRLLDAGCGTGALAVAAARRGADVTAVDVAASLLDVARERAPADLAPGRIAFTAGDMLDPGFGRVDYVVAMDSLIHYSPADMTDALARLAERCERAILFTVAPWSPMLATMHVVGRAFPRADRAPAIVPVRASDLARRVAAEPRLAGWRFARSQRIVSGFYTSEALELVREAASA